MAGWGHAAWAIVLVVPAGAVRDMDEAPALEVVRPVNVPHDPHVVVRSPREGGVVEEGIVVVYHVHGAVALWCTTFVTALEVGGSICKCRMHWHPHDVHRPRDAVFFAS